MLTARSIGYRWPGGRELFRNVQLELRPGDAVAVEGPSGVGKSTLLAVLGQLLLPTEGTVSVASGVPSSFAWVLQSLNTLGGRSVLANASLIKLIDGESRQGAERAARDVLELLGMAHLANQRAKELSGGELQRLTVARALVSTRRIILADEPTNQLDRANAQLVMSALVGAAESGRAVVIVTHDRESLPPHCRVLRLTEGGLDAP